MKEKVKYWIVNVNNFRIALEKIGVPHQEPAHFYSVEFLKIVQNYNYTHSKYIIMYYLPTHYNNILTWDWDKFDQKSKIESDPAFEYQGTVDMDRKEKLLKIKKKLNEK